MKVLGVDPGYDRMGVAIIERENGSDNLLYSDCITTSAKLPFSDRLLAIGEGFEKILKEWKPDVLSVEKLFFTKSKTTAMGVSEARGVICFLARKHELKFSEFTPGEIKMCVSGYGGSSKDQVIAMISRLVKINKSIKHDDEYDAIAAAYTYLSHHNFFSKVH